MKETPQVSVVIVFLDAKAFLEEAVESVRAQTFRDWELLLVDDGSTDGSGEIARRYAASAPQRVRYLQHPGGGNRGISASRNLGINRSTGRYIAMLDADDAWLPTLLERQVGVLREQPRAAMTYGPVQRWHGWRGRPEDAGRDFVAYPLDRYDTLVEPPEIMPTLLQHQYGVPLGMLMRREVVRETGGYEDEFAGMCDDMVFLSKLCLHHAVYVTSECGYRYRQHPDSCVWVSFRSRTYLEARVIFYDWLIGYLAETGITDEHIWNVATTERWKVRHPVAAGRLRGMKERLSWTRNRLRRTARAMRTNGRQARTFAGSRSQKS